MAANNAAAAAAPPPPAGNEPAPAHEYKFAGDRGTVLGDDGEPRLTLSVLLSRDGSRTSVGGAGIERFKKIKPWEHRKKSTSTKIRIKLPTIDTYDKEVVSYPHATPKVMVRLERVTGTDRVRIKNYKYLNMLSKRIAEEEEKVVGRNHKRRKDEELRRYRDLVIRGEIEPITSEGMEEIMSHPLYRVNRIMKRLDAMKFSTEDILNPRMTKPKITPIEPFQIYERTGILFGHHKDHYLKHKRPTEPAVRATSTASSAGSEKLEDAAEEEEEEVDLVKPVYYEEEWDGEGYTPVLEVPPPRRSQTSVELTPETALDLGHLLRRSSMSMARRYLGLATPDDSTSQPQRSRIIEEFLYSEDPSGQPMYDLASGISGAMQRTQAKTDEFCVKTHRKLFTG